MKSHEDLLQVVLSELGTRCCTSTASDFKRIRGRVEAEGLSFLTITLPSFGKDFRKSLDQGKVTRSLFKSFAKSGCLPKLFRGFTSRVFDSSTGLLLDEPSIDCVQAVLQASGLFAKLNLPCTKTREDAAFAQFIQCEQDVRTFDRGFKEEDNLPLARIFRTVFGEALQRLDREIYESEMLPKHGPGATAERLTSNGKYNLRQWTERLDQVFLHSEYLFSSQSHFLESDPVDILEPGAEMPVRVVSVPKTLKTPRIIAIEPACMMYAQKAISERLVELLEGHDLPSKFTGFSSQEPNRLMARNGSLHGNLATLDLSEASDRVSNQLVRFLFARWPWVNLGLDATRSRKADVPGYGVIRLAKFASMGSALCFPIEAMVFVAIALLGIERASSKQLSRKDLCDLAGQVRVFGDDIIVPSDCAVSVAEALESFGLKVNSDKSFWTGKFRESCGKEYFNGFDVSHVKVRRNLPTRRGHVPEIVSAVETRNLFHLELAMDQTAEFLDKVVQRFIPLPYVGLDSQGLGRHSRDGYYDVTRMCSVTHQPLVKAAVVTGMAPRDPLEGHGALLKWFLKRGDKPFDEDHLERAGRPKHVNIKLRYVSPL